MVTRIQMIDVEDCLICGKHIGKGRDPAVCSDDCLYWYKVECDFNRWARQQAACKHEEFLFDGSRICKDCGMVIDTDQQIGGK